MRSFPTQRHTSPLDWFVCLLYKLFLLKNLLLVTSLDTKNELDKGRRNWVKRPSVRNVTYQFLRLNKTSSCTNCLFVCLDTLHQPQKNVSYWNTWVILCYRDLCQELDSIRLPHAKFLTVVWHTSYILSANPFPCCNTKLFFWNTPERLHYNHTPFRNLNISFLHIKTYIKYLRISLLNMYIKLVI